MFVVQTPNKRKSYKATFRTIKTGSHLFRWIPPDDHTYTSWLNSKEYQYNVYNNPKLRSGTLGGGIYVSPNPFDWYSYEGTMTKLIILELRQDIQVLDLASMMNQLDGEKVTVSDFANRLLAETNIDAFANNYGIIAFEHTGSHKGELSLINCQIKGQIVFELVEPKFNYFETFNCDWTFSKGIEQRFQNIAHTLQRIFQINPIKDDYEVRKNMLLAMECVDYFDLLHELALGQQKPWLRYGSEYFDRWKKAIETLHDQAKKMSDYDLIIKLYRIFYNENDQQPIQYRKRDIVAGGGIYKEGRLVELQKDTSDGQYFIRATEQHLKALKMNPQIKIVDEFVIGTKYKNMTEYAVRYAYVPHETIPTTLKSIANNSNLTVFEKYQQLIGLHPFFDRNGRIMRAFLRLKIGAPLFMLSWDLDICLSPEEFEKTVHNGIVEYMRIAYAFRQTEKETVDVQFLSQLPVIWEYPFRAMLSHDHITFGLVAISKIRNWFKTSTANHLVSKKLPLDMLRHLDELVYPQRIQPTPAPVPTPSVQTNFFVPQTPPRIQPTPVAKETKKEKPWWQECSIM